MDLNFIVLFVTLCFTIGLILHIVVERGKDKREREQLEQEKRKRVRETLKRLDWKQKA